MEPQRAPKTKAQPLEGKLGFVTGLNLWTRFRNRMVRRQAPSAIKPDMLGRNRWKINKVILLHPLSSTEMEECPDPHSPLLKHLLFVDIEASSRQCPHTVGC